MRRRNQKFRARIALKLLFGGAVEHQMASFEQLLSRLISGYPPDDQVNRFVSCRRDFPLGLPDSEFKGVSLTVLDQLGSLLLEQLQRLFVVLLRDLLYLVQHRALGFEQHVLAHDIVGRRQSKSTVDPKRCC